MKPECDIPAWMSDDCDVVIKPSRKVIVRYPGFHFQTKIEYHINWSDLLDRANNGYEEWKSGKVHANP